MSTPVFIPESALISTDYNGIFHGWEEDSAQEFYSGYRGEDYDVQTHRHYVEDEGDAGAYAAACADSEATETSDWDEVK